MVRSTTDLFHRPRAERKAVVPASAILVFDRLERARWPRYRRGWQRYLEAIGPVAADIDDEELSTPAIINDGAGTRTAAREP